MTDYTTEAQAVADAIASIYENKQTNKKNSISGDYSSDNESYPTVKAVKSEFGTKVTSWNNTVSDTNYPSEKLVKDTLDTKQATLVSGTTIKTINNETLLGSGNISISAGTSLDLLKVVAQLPTASADTMNQLYLVAESTAQTHDAYEIYVTVQTGSSPSYTYSWEKVDTARIDLSGYSTVDHTHGNITKDGKVGSSSGKPLITTTGGAVTTGAFGSNSGQFAEGNHTHSTYCDAGDVEDEIEAFATALAAAINPSS